MKLSFQVNWKNDYGCVIETSVCGRYVLASYLYMEYNGALRRSPLYFVGYENQTGRRLTPKNALLSRQSVIDILEGIAE